ncbi:hypothetical protein CL656_04800 [bacterium]|nr:hypothetical protein [bacterium]|tara:strand:- start:288 stop:743 length:456 start_codon:yes stop_codon:yes gene_type:complete
MVQNKRFGTEIDKLLKNGNTYSIHKDNNDLIIIEKKYTKNLCLKIALTCNYPFGSPDIYINNSDYCKYITSHGKYMNEMLHIFNIPCPCCYTILNNWSPGYYLKDVIEEYETNLRMFNLMVKMYYIKKYINKRYSNKDDKLILQIIINYLE